MIGVLAEDGEENVIREFFELFKTPWEFFRDGRNYPVLLSTRGDSTPSNARLFILYSSGQTVFDTENRISVRPTSENRAVCRWGEKTLPLYGKVSSPDAAAGRATRLRASAGDAVAIEINDNGKTAVRAGFDLFREIRVLLTTGQPVAFSRIPTLDLHISILRDWILDADIPLAEIPPVPAGCDFTCCLTHDIDFYGIRRHKFDRTMFGFLYRALWGSLRDALKGKCRWEKVLRNWKAALSLPAVHAGLKEDFWQPFKSYREAERKLPSTFFVIPFKEKAGPDGANREDVLRACRYDVADIQDDIRDLLSQGCEVAVHGIDAWRNAGEGKKELERIRQATGNADTGIRMHWLYFNDQSARALEEAGYRYDSTAGYNEAVGYRCGTGQAFRPPGLERLLELPMNIQDTALFYPDRMGLTDEEAWPLVRGLLENAKHHGGALTVNWHDRSLAPERLWGDFYVRILEALRGSNAWVATATRAVRWFDKRRSAIFEETAFANGMVKLRIQNRKDDDVPDLVLRIHQAETRPSEGDSPAAIRRKHLDIPFSNVLNAEIPARTRLA